MLFYRWLHGIINEYRVISKSSKQYDCSALYDWKTRLRARLNDLDVEKYEANYIDLNYKYICYT